MTNKYTTVLFDADNTLLDFDKDERQALIRTMNNYGVPVSEENISTYSEINKGLWKQFEKGEITKPQLKRVRFRMFFDAIGFESNADSLEVNEHYLALLGEGGNTLEGAKDVLESLKVKGYNLYIVTNGVALTQAKRLERSGLLPYITDVFVSETVGYQKPKKEYFDYVLEKVDEKDKSKIILVGDSLSSDIKGATDSGIDCIWLNLFGNELTDGLKPDCIIKKITDITEIL